MPKIKKKADPKPQIITDDDIRAVLLKVVIGVVKGQKLSAKECCALIKHITSMEKRLDDAVSLLKRMGNTK